MILILLVLIPFLAGVLCLMANSRLWWERANLLAFGIVAVLSILVGLDVSKEGKVVALGG